MLKNRYWHFDVALREVGLCYEKEYLFAKAFGRKWRSDYYFKSAKNDLAVEIEGGAYINGRHTRGSGFIKDMEKYNCYQLLDIRLLRFTPEQIARNPFSVANLIKGTLLGENKNEIIAGYLK